jgi:hypothetical protein
MIIAIFTTLANGSIIQVMPYDPNAGLFQLEVAIISALLGVLMGFGVSEIRDLNRSKMELEKIHVLLSEEFNRLLVLTKEVMAHTKDFKTQLTTAEYLRNIISDDLILKKAIMNTIQPLKFAYWKSLESSGSLIKLEAREIQLVQSAHDYLEATNANSEMAGMGVRRDIDEYFPRFSELSKRIWINSTLIPYVETSFKSCEETYNALYSLIEINWMNLPEPSYQATTETIIPNKRKVTDSHGSWEWV